MTREDILGMEAGEKLDRLIAIYVFKWQEGINTNNISGWQWTSRDGNPVLDGSWDKQWVSVSNPEWSTDIKAAWEVVEKMREKGFGIYMSDFYDGEYAFKFINQNAIVKDQKVKAKTAPEAICKTALLALMEVKG